MESVARLIVEALRRYSERHTYAASNSLATNEFRERDFSAGILLSLADYVPLDWILICALIGCLWVVGIILFSAFWCVLLLCPRLTRRGTATEQVIAREVTIGATPSSSPSVALAAQRPGPASFPLAMQNRESRRLRLTNEPDEDVR